MITYGMGVFVMSLILWVIQLCVTVVVGLYFAAQLRNQQKAQPAVRKDSAQEMTKLRKMRSIALSEPLSEHVRPVEFRDIIGQEDGIKSLKAILCGHNPQHVIIYGPPGIGKTCAARLVLECDVNMKTSYDDTDRLLEVLILQLSQEAKHD